MTGKKLKDINKLDLERDNSKGRHGKKKRASKEQSNIKVDMQAEEYKVLDSAKINLNHAPMVSDVNDLS